MIPEPHEATQPLSVKPLAAPWRELRHFAVLDSTQRHAARLAEAGENLAGVVLWAETQTAGHGRQGRMWASSGGGLWVTAGLPSDAAVADAYLGWLPLVAALRCARLIRERCQVPAVLKWPNDVLISGRKVAGVIGEVSLSGASRRRRLLVGMGLNWANAVSDAAAAGGFSAVALAELVPGLEPSARPGFLIEWLARLAQDAIALAENPEETVTLLHEEVEALLWRRGQAVTLEHTEQGRVEGKLLGLARDGSARIELEDGSVIETQCGAQTFAGAEYEMPPGGIVLPKAPDDVEKAW